MQPSTERTAAPMGGDREGRDEGGSEKKRQEKNWGGKEEAVHVRIVSRPGSAGKPRSCPQVLESTV